MKWEKNQQTKQNKTETKTKQNKNTIKKAILCIHIAFFAY